MIFAETPRLHLRALKRDELPRLRRLIDEWEIARWLSVLPYPYTSRDAEQFYAILEPSYAQDKPQFYAMSFKTDPSLIGGVGLHDPRGSDAEEGEIEIGYWLGREYWGQGLMSEAVSTVIAKGFENPANRLMSATTALKNLASQNVLRKAGFRCLGERPRSYEALRGDPVINRWVLTREEWASAHERT